MAAWLVRRGGKTMGPVSVEYLREKAASGALLPTDEIKQQGRTDWVPCGTVKGLFPSTIRAVSPMAGVAAPPPRVATPPSAGSSAAGEHAAVADDEDDFYGSLPARPAVATPSVPVGGRPEAYARFLPRLAAFLLDALFVGFLPVFVLGLLIGLLTPLLGMAAIGVGPAEVIIVIIQLILPLVAAAYFIAFETSAKQATWGKQIVGLRVEGIRGERISFGKSLGRYASKCLSYLTFGLVFFMPLFTKRRQAMHDLMAATVVVDDDA